MFKKAIHTIVAILLILAMTLAVVSCSLLQRFDESETESNITAESNSQTNSETDSETQAQEACEHAQTSWKVDVAPTCSQKGSRSLVCDACDTTLDTEEISNTAHTEIIIAGTPATCNSAGLTSGKKCSVCDAMLVEQQAIPLLAHTEQVIDAVPPTCTQAGWSAGKKCSVCQTVLLEPQELASLGHSESDWIIDLPAEVGVEGKKHTECTHCEELMSSDKIPAIDPDHNHEGKEWIISVQPTCAKEGIKILVCSCGKEMDSQTVQKSTVHVEETILGTRSTCTSTGLTDGKKCSVCGVITLQQQPTAKSPHTKETVLGTAATCTEYGTTSGEKCSVCTATITPQLPIPPSGHDFKLGCCTVCGEAESYGIWIVDGLGHPVSNVIVKILKNGELIKMHSYKGEHLALDLERDTYQIELDLSQTGVDYTYDTTLCTLTPENPSTTIRLFKTTSDPTSVFVGYPISSDYNAYEIVAGSYEIPLTPNDYTFFIFRPTSAAVYSITYECESNLQISYHGSSFFVQGSDLSGSSDDISTYENGLAVSVYASNIGEGFDMVFAVWSGSATSCILNIENAGDPGTRLEDEPWVPYLEDEDKVKEQLAAKKDGTYTAIDVTDLSVAAVYNSDDGYYHLGSENGPVIFIDLTTDSRFISSIQTICANQRMGTYIYDESGAVAEKRSYNELFIQYGMPGDTSKVPEPIRVPLTAKLAEAIQKFGNKNGWWSDNPDINIFHASLLGAPYNQEFAWLLYCGYYS